MFRQKQEIYNLLLGAISEGIIIVDEKQIIVDANRSAEKMFGYNKNELLTQPLNILISPDLHKKHVSHFKGFIEDTHNNKGMERVVSGIRKDGSSFSVQLGLNKFSVYNKNYVLALVKDVTDIEISEQEKAHFSKIFHESLNEIFVCDAQTLKFINVNYGAQKNLGYTLDELKLMTPLDIKPHYTEKDFRASIELISKENITKLEFECAQIRKDGTIYPVEVHLQRSNIGDRDVFVAIVLDITERKNYTENLEKTVAKRTEELRLALITEKEHNLLKSKFLTLVSHEFKTPLSGILTSSILLSKYTLTKEQEKRDKHIETITVLVNSLDNILNDFLSVEKFENGYLKYTPSKFKLSKVIEGSVYNANVLLKEGQKINYPKDLDAISLYLDENHLELILSNLVNNAVKYSSENATIDIDIYQNDKVTIFNIKDNGIGIPEKDQKNIFNRYYRAENVLKTQGTGIGLNIVKNHLDFIGGSISFESKENVGSTFTITVPNIYEK